MDLVREWLRLCCSSHTSCVGRSEIADFVPTRLIDIGEKDDKLWRVVATNGDTHTYGRYVAVSHRWGDASVPKLDFRTRDQLFSGSSYEVLPKHYQDVINITHALGLRYIWIDSLCIDQTSESDWEAEAGTMLEVYSHAYCTLAVCRYTSDGCLPKRDPNDLKPLRLKVSGDAQVERELFFINKDMWRLAISNAPLLSRGWVLQERIMSRRILYLGNDQIFWECEELTACEVFPSGMPSATHCDPQSRNTMEWTIAKPSTRFARGGLGAGYSTEDIEQAYRFWADIVNEYSRCDLSFERDRLIAISGLAKLVQKVTRDQYLAGLWRDRLKTELLWFVEDSIYSRKQPKVKQDQKMSPQSHVPSWSWASVGGFCKSAFYDVEYDRYLPLVTFGKVDVVPTVSDEFGLIQSASIEMTGLIIPVTVEVKKHLGIKIELRRYKLSETSYQEVTLDGILDDIPLWRTQLCFVVPLLYNKGSHRVSGLVLLQPDPTVLEFTRLGVCHSRFYWGFMAAVIIHHGRRMETKSHRQCFSYTAEALQSASLDGSNSKQDEQQQQLPDEIKATKAAIEHAVERGNTKPANFIEEETDFGVCQTITLI